MYRTPLLLIGLIILLLPLPAWSKGETVRISIRASSPEALIEITDPAIVSRFNIWNGPGANVDSEPYHLDPQRQNGAFIDWPRGPATKRPGELLKYDVTFYIGRPDMPAEQNAYTFEYEVDVAMGQGYVMLPPGPNTELIRQGVEGTWFFASKAWDEAIMPLVLKRP